MKLLESYWVLALLALLINGATVAGTLFLHKNDLLAPQAPPQSNEFERRALWWDFHTSAVDKLVEDLRTETRKVEQREMDVAEIEARLNAEREELNRLRKQMEIFRKQLTEQIIVIEQGELKNLRILATTYSNLSLQAAIVILEKLEDSFVVKILAMMKPDVVSAIFEQMVKDSKERGPMAQRVAEITEMLRLHAVGKTPES